MQQINRHPLIGVPVAGGILDAGEDEGFQKSGFIGKLKKLFELARLETRKPPIGVKLCAATIYFRPDGLSRGRPRGGKVSQRRTVEKLISVKRKSIWPLQRIVESDRRSGHLLYD